MPSFFKVHGGAVVSMTIDKYIYISINRKFDGRIRLSYSKTENVEHPEQLEHDVAREALSLFHQKGVEITSVSDIPGEGTGLGSSSSYAVGLITALTEFNRGKWHPASLAESAFILENQFCGHSTGKQDQYAAAYGGLKFYEFYKSGNVCVQPYDLHDEEKCMIMGHILMLWSGRTRPGKNILIQQSVNLAGVPDSIAAGEQLRHLAYELNRAIAERHFNLIGGLLHQGWVAKKSMASGITNAYIDEAYEKAVIAGAEGGKVCGAGGGGFLLLWAKPELHDQIERAVGWPRMPVCLEELGSTVIFNGEVNGHQQNCH